MPGEGTGAASSGGGTGGSSGPDPAVMEAIEQRGNAVVFLDVALGDGDDAVDLGRIKLELFVKDVSVCFEFVFDCICFVACHLYNACTLNSVGIRLFLFCRCFV